MKTVRGDERRRTVQTGLSEVHGLIGERLLTTLIPADTTLSPSEIAQGTRELERQLEPQVEQILALERELRRAHREVEEEKEAVEGFREAAQATEQYQQRLHRSRLHPALQTLDSSSTREGAPDLQTPLHMAETALPSDAPSKRDQTLERSLKDTFNLPQHHLPHLSNREAETRADSIGRIQQMEDRLLNALDRRGILPQVMDRLDQASNP
ncbi:hypothetical protein BJ684DRAFT_18511 [Piptocephalis cylindrospora]|uniref:Uncharacterized protein n=1 Tax=Piptocephalis cylindrospora TaxID=1907219 RepID=A0A4P9YAM2_9FUNG|nr:hypothetical protein BJ684DRAFT_18511 [Piptocephalis cylindrospora]|eukprot:RKP15140.1 hypothetical protein BJ684DRAFT_18511 [Piptocephalis cylindrospora]